MCRLILKLLGRKIDAKKENWKQLTVTDIKTYGLVLWFIGRYFINRNEAVVTYLWYYPSFYLEGVAKNMKCLSRLLVSGLRFECGTIQILIRMLTITFELSVWIWSVIHKVIFIRFLVFMVTEVFFVCWGLWHHIVLKMVTSISNKHIAFISWVDGGSKLYKSVYNHPHTTQYCSAVQKTKIQNNFYLNNSFISSFSCPSTHLIMLM
jgi:hypothetical protein